MILTFRTLISLCILVPSTLWAQYEIKDKVNVECTEVKSQNRTGTCWSFATASFIESELMRQGKGTHDLSEMFVVRNIYKDKARNYLLRQGSANFSQGSLSHDLLRAISMVGVIPESVYNGLAEGEKAHDHSEMEAGLKGFLDGIRTQKRLSPKWEEAFDHILDAYMGKAPSKFEYQGKSHTPETLKEELQIDVEEYVSITSFTHHPFGKKFILEIPDNYSNGSYHNVSLDELMRTIDQAVERGFSVAWDGDVSEKGFDARKGMALLPTDVERKDLFENPGEETKVTQDNRQSAFENWSTTDDHLMHIVGIAYDSKGTKYYKIKNSWGEISPYKGYLYMSEAYARMKTVSITLHKDGVPKGVL